MHIAIREYDPETDKGMVYKYWLRSHGFYVRGLPRRKFYEVQHAVIERLLERSTTLMAISPDDHDAILGFVVGEPARYPDDWHVFHYVFVKEPFRELRIAEQLVNAHRALGTGWAPMVATASTLDWVRARLSRSGVEIRPELAHNEEKKTA